MNTQKETILIFALTSIMVAVGSIAFICGMLGVKFKELGGLTVCGFVVGLSGLFFSILLLAQIGEKNREKR